MSSPPRRLVFLVDENAPASVGVFLAAQGYETHSIKKSTFAGEPDDVIAKLGHILSRELDANVIVVTFNRKHFMKIISRRPPNNNLRYRNLGRLSLLCPYPMAVKRLRETLDDIEREFALCQTRSDKRMIMAIDETEFRIER